MCNIKDASPPKLPFNAAGEAWTTAVLCSSSFMVHISPFVNLSILTYSAVIPLPFHLLFHNVTILF